MTALTQASSSIASRDVVKPHRGRIEVRGKFLYRDGVKLYVKGVTYGTFRPRVDSVYFPEESRVEQDFAMMVRHGINAIRTYTEPPRWLLDKASSYGLLVMIGIPWEQHITFLDDPVRGDAIEHTIRNIVRSCGAHPAVLCFTLGNEIPATIVRWYGKKKVERFIKRLYDAAKQEDPDAIVTYVNYPSTEYLSLPFLDIFSFNVYLESEESLDKYLARLQSIAGDRPLLLGEVGLDSRRNGEEKQSAVLEWQLRTSFAQGCAGLFVFAWTDEWFRGGHDIDDWDFGLTTRDRIPKPSLETIGRMFAEVPFPPDDTRPLISIIVCAYNAEETVAETLEAIGKLQYPNFETIFVNDGSTDHTAAVVRRFPSVNLMQTENLGLSNARNVGLHAARGEIVAYIDADAYPDPHWLEYLAYTFKTTPHVGVGGPNISPVDASMMADCVANAPGGPAHVLFSDQEAEHIPGCNMAFRKESLIAVGGFDTQFRSAGDDVDVCWRLQDRGWTLGFSPAALVWHHRRRSVRSYWRQQRGYGKAEALLERKFPEKYNRLGHMMWRGRMYGPGQMVSPFLNGSRVYHGTWGTGLFQSLYDSRTSHLFHFPLMPEWYLVVTLLGLMLLLPNLGEFLFLIVPLWVLSISVVMTQAVYSVNQARFSYRPGSQLKSIQRNCLAIWLHLIQPAARLSGRLAFGLTPFRRRSSSTFSFPMPRHIAVWREQWQSSTSILEQLELEIRARGPGVYRGGDFDRWDLEVRAGNTGAVRLLATVEDHGGGKQFLRFRSWPMSSTKRFGLIFFFALLAVVAVTGGELLLSVIFGLLSGYLGAAAFLDCGYATGALLSAIGRIKEGDGG